MGGITMISVKVQGGLGNQLFQYAAALQLSEQGNTDVFLDNSYFEEEKYRILFRLDKYKIHYTDTTGTFPRDDARSLSARVLQKLFYTYSFFTNPGGNVVKGDLLKQPVAKLANLDHRRKYLLEGWLQRTDYFSAVKTQLSEALWLKEEIAPRGELVDQLRTCESVAVHIRRGDMVLNPNFVTLDSSYYKSAVDRIQTRKKNAQFFVFSDEPEKARELFSQIQCSVTFITGQSESLGYYGTKGDYVDFELMRHCRNFIVANSTFSWWPAYLSANPEKMVVAPREWFTGDQMRRDFGTSGLLQSDWIVI